MASLAESKKLLPWCISSGVPFCYMDDTLVTTVLQGKNATATTAAPRPEKPPAPGFSSSPTHLTETPPVILLLPDLPFVGSPHVRHPFFESAAGPLQEKWDHSPIGSFGDYFGKRTLVHSPEVEVRGEHCSTWGDQTKPELVPEAGTEVSNESRNLLVHLPVQLGPSLILIKPHQTPTHQGRMWLTLI